MTKGKGTGVDYSSPRPKLLTCIAGAARRTTQCDSKRKSGGKDRGGAEPYSPRGEAREAARRSTPTRPPPAGDLGWGRRRRPVSGLIARTRFWAFCWGSGGVWNHSLSVTVLLELEGGRLLLGAGGSRAEASRWLLFHGTK
jgi:hypothetical protein